MSTEEMDHVEREADLAWELYEALPTHPEVPRLALRVLAASPQRSGMRILLARHHEALDEFDAAREVLLDLAGRQDQQFVNAARALRDLAITMRDHDEALRWAEVVLRHEQEDWYDHMRLGVATTLATDLETGWRRMDDAVDMCARTDPDSLPYAYTHRALFLLVTYAPVPRFLDAAQRALEANPADEFLTHALAYAYLHEYRLDDAEQHLLGILRADPTDEIAPSLLKMTRTVQAKLEKHEVTVELLRQQGLMELAWGHMRAKEAGTTLADALAALDDLLPDALRAALHPPADRRTAAESHGSPEVAAWHDGQQAGTGALWGEGNTFRLLSAAEVAAMDDAIEQEPEAFPQWDADGSYYLQVLTDDVGSYLIEGPRGALYRRSADGDVEIAPSVADWFWDRVADFGGADPRPAALRSSH